MYHVSRFWPFVTILYITKMHPTSENCFFFCFFVFKLILKQKKFCCDLTTQTSFFDLKMRSPVQKLIWNLYFLFYHRFRHPKFSPKNQSEGVYRDKKNLPDLLLYVAFTVSIMLFSNLWKHIRIFFSAKVGDDLWMLVTYFECRCRTLMWVDSGCTSYCFSNFEPSKF